MKVCNVCSVWIFYVDILQVKVDKIVVNVKEEVIKMMVYVVEECEKGIVDLYI